MARSLDLAECYALLRERRWGILAVTDAATTRPYAVPVAFALDNDAIYIAVGPGRKLRALESNPGLCLTVTDVEHLDCWRSVVVMGSARWVADEGCRAAAIRAFVRQQRTHGLSVPPASMVRLVAGRMFRVEVAELTGRAAGRVALARPRRADAMQNLTTGERR